MSAAQRGPRRLSARLQGKDDVQPTPNGAQTNERQVTSATGIAGGSSRDAGPAAKKRKMEYDEEDDGFAFTRVKKRKPRASSSRITTANEVQATAQPAASASPPRMPLKQVDENTEPAKKRRNKMSFSTPGRNTEEPVRRSKRLSIEDEDFRAMSKQAKRPKERDTHSSLVTLDESKHTASAKQPQGQDQTPAPATSTLEGSSDDHNGTKISLPFADTPVIKRNKAMREGKTGKGERRSSLGLRGRRASSLIEAGNSNALPHQEVEIPDFYKHIESEGLPEPRRMRQLLTWCATRALGEKSTGGEFEDQSARMAARVIQEELLKDLANRSEMSDWFSREDAPAPSKATKTRPNPKNEQNAAKIKELEEQIERLRTNRNALESLSQPPSIPKTEEIVPDPESTGSHKSLLSPEDAALFDSLKTASSTTHSIQNRLNSISTSLGPVIDSFADGIHQIAQYSDAADKIAGRALGICAEKLAEKENQGRLIMERSRQPSPGTQLGNVLRSLSRVEQ